MIIGPEEIGILLNTDALNGAVEIDVSYPPYQQRLFTLNLADFSITDVISRKSMDAMKRKHARSEFLRRDLPDYHDLLDAFISSAVLDFENRAEIEENFDLLRRAVSDRTIYVKPVFIGIDTNIAYYRVISRRFRNHFKYVISNIVVEEIDARIHTKYSGKMIRELEGLPYSHLFREFSNGSVKDARKAKNALNEIQHIINVLDAFRIGKSTDTVDKEVRDREIARQYSEFSNEINAEVVLLTADKDMVYHAQAEQMSSIFFKLPHQIPGSLKATPAAVNSLIYDLTLIFGMVKVGSHFLLGEWHGKSGEDYIAERIRVYNPSREDALHVNICRRIYDVFQRDAR